MTEHHRHRPPQERDHPFECDDERLCALDCLVRPCFEAGQILRADELEELVSWTSARFALSRYRHGWGVVCGLDVRVDPTYPSRVIVEPGYALSCCGEDLVLCERACVDLTCFCKERCDPCIDTRPETERTFCEIAGRRYAMDDLVAVDVLLTTRETAMACGCGCAPQGQQCGRARNDHGCSCGETGERAWRARFVSEKPLAWARLATDPSPPWELFAERWRRCLDVEPDWQPRHFPWACDDKYWRILDCRLGLLAGPCPDCDCADLVRLSRVWIHRKAENNERKEGESDQRTDDRWRHRGCCHVVHVAIWPPYRRPITRDWPSTRPGLVDLASLAFWRQAEIARAELRQASLAEWGIEKITELGAEHLAGEPWVELGTGGMLYVFEDTCFEIAGRVVGWSPEKPAERRRRR